MSFQTSRVKGSPATPAKIPTSTPPKKRKATEMNGSSSISSHPAAPKGNANEKTSPPEAPNGNVNEASCWSCLCYPFNCLLGAMKGLGMWIISLFSSSEPVSDPKPGTVGAVIDIEEPLSPKQKFMIERGEQFLQLVAKKICVEPYQLKGLLVVTTNAPPLFRTAYDAVSIGSMPWKEELKNLKIKKELFNKRTNILYGFIFQKDGQRKFILSSPLEKNSSEPIALPSAGRVIHPCQFGRTNNILNVISNEDRGMFSHINKKMAGMDWNEFEITS